MYQAKQAGKGRVALFDAAMHTAGLARIELERDLRAALADAGLRRSRLTLEVAERAIVRDVERTVATLHALEALGVRLAVDDFGTGYSSLGHLQRFPVDVLKIDRTFVDGVARGGSDAALARTVIALGTALRLRTVGEGVEHAERATALRALGCDLGQGDYFSPPVAGDVLADLLGRLTPRP